MFKTKNGAKQAGNLGNPIYEFLSKAGSFAQETYYAKPQNMVKQFFLAFSYDPLLAMKSLFWLRDPRGGSGQRKLFRQLLGKTGSVSTFSEWMKVNTDKVPEYGRFDDLFSLFETSAESTALGVIKDALDSEDRLVAKWLPRPNKKSGKRLKGVAPKVRDYMSLTNKEYRLLLVKLTDVVEDKMSSRNWEEIELSKVPGVSMMRNSKAFERHIPEQWTKFVESKTTKVKTTAAYPHEVMRMLKAQVDDQMIKKTWGDMVKNNIVCSHRLLPVIDQSGSMFGTYLNASGSLTAGDVAATLGMYLSEFLPDPFTRKFMTFSSRPEIVSWKHKTFQEGINFIHRQDHLSTNIIAVFESLLDYAQLYNVPQTDMPEALVIMSDMQFDSGDGWDSVNIPGASIIEKCLANWKLAGYEPPAIVLWNLAGYAGQPISRLENSALISGFSPAILKPLFESMDKIDGRLTINYDMLVDKALEKYQVVSP